MTVVSAVRNDKEDWKVVTKFAMYVLNNEITFRGTYTHLFTSSCIMASKRTASKLDQAVFPLPRCCQ